MNIKEKLAEAIAESDRDKFRDAPTWQSKLGLRVHRCLCNQIVIMEAIRELLTQKRVRFRFFK